MFLTTTDGQIFQIREGKAILGNSASCEIRLTGHGVEAKHCEISEDGAGKWSIKTLCDRPISVNGALLREGSLPISQHSRIQISTYDFEVWHSSASSPISKRLRAWLFDFEREIHNEILDKLRNLPPADETEDRERIEGELERRFRNTRIDPEPEAYLASQALSDILMNRIHGIGNKGIPDSIKADVIAVVARIEGMLKIGPAGVATDKIEKVEALMPWVMRTNASLLEPKLRRGLAEVLLRVHLIDFIFGFGPIGDLMQLPDVNDIMVLPSGFIFIERRGQMQDSGRKMLSPDVSHRIVERIITKEGRRIDEDLPMVDARMKHDGSRLHAIIKPLAVHGPALTIRRFSDRRTTLEELVALGTIPENVREFLAACVMARKNIVISGGTGSGKTTLLNALAARISPEERIITVEDTAEIRLFQTHIITLQARPANLEGKGEITIRRLVQNTLRMRPDRILVGECRGGETLDMLQAMNTGHAGSMTTVHANSAPDAIRRLETMTMVGDSNLPSRAIREQISSAVDIIIQITRMKDIRRVISVCEVVEFEQETESVIVEEVFAWRERRWKKGRIGQGRLEFTGYVPVFFDELLNHGAKMTCLVS